MPLLIEQYRLAEEHQIWPKGKRRNILKMAIEKLEIVEILL